MELRLKFNEDATNYDKWRPRYVPGLFADIIEYSSLDDTQRALEVGIGTGQATLPILKTGCKVTAVEIGKELAEYSRQKFSGFRNFEVVDVDFESFHEQSNTYDLIYSATAFHWIPEEIGYSKAFDLLKPGGTLALFWNHPFVNRRDDMLHAEIQEIYSKYRPSDGKPRVEFNQSSCEKVIDTLRSHGFSNIMSRLFYQTRTLSSRDYIGLLNTYSDHRVLKENIRNSFEREIVLAIDRFGGKVNIYDTMDLYLAQKI